MSQIFRILTPLLCGTVVGMLLGSLLLQTFDPIDFIDCSISNWNVDAGDAANGPTGKSNLDNNNKPLPDPDNQYLRDINQNKKEIVYSEGQNDDNNNNDDLNDFEPRYVTQPPSEPNRQDSGSANSKQRPKLNRPRFLATELAMKDKLYVAVVTSLATLESSAIPLNRTWLPSMASKLVYYIDGSGRSASSWGLKSNLNIVGLGQANSGPNDSKGVNGDGQMGGLGAPSVDSGLDPVRVLDYLQGHLADNYDWFLVVPDWAYVNGYALSELVSHVSCGHDIVLGKPLIRDRPEMEPVGSTPPTKGCGFGAGLLFSRGALLNHGAGFKKCLYTTTNPNGGGSYKKSGLTDEVFGFEDCLFDGLPGGLECRESFQNYKYSSFQTSIDQLSEKTEISYLLDLTKDRPSEMPPSPLDRSTISVFPLHSSSSYYLLDQHFCSLEIERSVYQMNELKDEIRNLSRKSGEEHLHLPLSSTIQWRPKNRWDVPKWDFFRDDELFLGSSSSNRQSIRSINRLELDLVIDFAKSQLTNKYPGMFGEIKLISGYRSWDPIGGMEYILDLALRPSVENERYHESNRDAVLTKRVRVLKPLNQVEIIPMPYVTEANQVNIVLPVRPHEVKATLAFLDMYNRLVLASRENVALIVVLVSDTHFLDPMVFAPVTNALRNLLLAYKQASSPVQITYTIVNKRRSGPVSPEQVIDHVMQEPTTSSHAGESSSHRMYLLVHPLVAELKPEFLNRVRMNTLLGRQVFFPVPFVQFHPGLIAKAAIIKNQADQAAKVDDAGNGNGGSDPQSVFGTPGDLDSATSTVNIKFEIHKDVGRFDEERFKIVSFYGGDFVAAKRLSAANEVPRGFDRDQNGNERADNHSSTDHSVDLLSMFFALQSVAASDLHILRATEPTLKVFHSSAPCDAQLGDTLYGQCLSNKKSGLASKSQLASLLLKQMEHEKML